MKFVTLAALVVAAVLAQPAEAGKKQVVCWNDKNGQRMCGDRVPPEYAGQKRDVIKDGRVVDTIGATKSAEEKEAEKRRKADEEKRIKQQEYDRALLESYRTPQDIAATRDERLALLDSRLQAAEKQAADTDKSLTGLRTRVEQQQKAEKAPDPKLLQQVKQFEKAQADNTKALDRLRKEREALQAKFDGDYMRFSELRGLPVTAPPPPKTAAAATPADKGEKKGATKAAPAAKDAPSAEPSKSAPPKT